MSIVRKSGNHQASWSENNEQQPPNLDELLKQGADWLKKVLNTPGNDREPMSQQAIKYVLGAVVGIYLLAGLYVVAPAERAVITRFGAYVSTELPGMHWRLLGMDSVNLVNVEQVAQLNYHAEMLTRDENYVDVDVAVMYRIVDPKLFLFAAVNPNESVYQAAGSAARQAAGQTTLEKIITTGRADVRAEIEKQLNNILDVYKMGVQIIDVKLQDAKPPQEVQEAFDDAIKAREDEQRFINKAMAYRSEVIPAAKGIAFQLINEAEAYRNSVVQQAKSETSLFQAASKAYTANPNVQSVRMQAAMVEQVLSANPKVISNSKNGLNILSINELLEKKVPEKVEVSE